MTHVAAENGVHSTVHYAPPSVQIDGAHIRVPRLRANHDSVRAEAKAVMPTNVLFFNSRDDYGADVAIHVALMRSFDRSKTQPFVLGNTQSDDAERMRKIYASIPDMKVRLAPLGLPSHQLSSRGRIAKAAVGCAITNSLVGAVKFIKTEKIDVIHATDRPRDAFLSTLLGRMCGVPSVVHMHSNAGDFLGKQTMAGLRTASAVFTVSENVRCGLIRLGIDEKKIQVVHNATDPEYFDPSKHAEWSRAARSRFGIPQENVVVGIVARLIPWKGHHELLDAFASLLPRHPQLTLLIVGHGTEESLLKQKVASFGIEQNVVFAGFSEDVPPLLAALDIFALPSYEEPFGLAITEAMSMQLPVIACNSGGVPEIITNDVDGILVEPRNSMQIATAIDTLIRNQEKRRKLGIAARKKVVAKFSPQMQADRVSLLYAQLATRR